MDRFLLAGALVLLGAPSAGCDSLPSSEATAAPSPVRAAEFRSSQVQEAMDAASEVILTRGFTHFGPQWRGFLVDRSSEVHEQPMRSGTCYVVAAAATSQVRDLDLRVFDSEGGQVVADGDDDSATALSVCPSQAGTYYVAVESAGSGIFEVRMYRGPTGLEIRLDDLFRSEPPDPPRESPL